MTSGQVIAAHSDFYEVLAEGVVYRCRQRGRFRIEGARVMVGDRVDFRPSGPQEGYIEVIHPRSTELRRPPVANVDQAVVVFALREPARNYALLDRFLVVTESKGLATVLCLNKCDLLTPDEVAEVVRYYEKAGYEVIPTSARQSMNLDALRRAMAGRTSVLAGQSGVGKSTLLNALIPEAGLATGDLSRKIRRGTHTTRTVRLLSTGDGLVADTPGFTHLEFDQMPPGRLAHLFREFRAFEDCCRFSGCLHDREPDCAVKEAVESGGIAPERYQHYQDFLREIKEAERTRY